MLFTKEVRNKTEVQAISGDLKVLVKSIPDLQIEGDANGSFTEDQKKLMDGVDLKTYMDHLPSKVPTTYEEAIQVYQALPESARNSPSPVRFSLTPIRVWCTAETRLINAITEKLAQSLSHVKQEIRDSKRKIETLQRMKLATDFPSYRKILGDVEDYVRRYEAIFNGNVSELVPAIRDGSAEDSELETLVDDYYKLPIAYGYLAYFLDMRKREIETAEYILSLGKTRKNNVIVDIEPSGKSNVCQQNKRFKLIMTLRILPDKKSGKDYLNETPGDWEEDTKWFKSLTTQGQIGELLAPFLTMSRESVGVPICFLIQLKPATTNLDIINLQAYSGSQIAMQNFALPGLVCAIDQLDSRFDEIILKIQYLPHQLANSIEAFLWNKDQGESFDNARVIKVTYLNQQNHGRRKRNADNYARLAHKTVVILNEDETEVWSYEQALLEDVEASLHGPLNLAYKSMAGYKDSAKMSFVTNMSAGDGLAEVTISGLKAETRYGLSFALLTFVGRGPKSADIVFKTSYESKPIIIQGSLDYPCHQHEPVSQANWKRKSKSTSTTCFLLFMIFYLRTGTDKDYDCSRTGET